MTQRKDFSVSNHALDTTLYDVSFFLLKLLRKIQRKFSLEPSNLESIEKNFSSVINMG